MRFKTGKIVAVISVLIMGISFLMKNVKDLNNDSLIVWNRFTPSSLDPMDYDLQVHHVTMRSVMASLVSRYKNGEVAPQIAKRWIVSDDQKVWTVYIDDNWNFKNGEKVTPEIVLKNFKRVLFLKNAQKSQSGLLEYLVGAKAFKKIDDVIEGMKIQGNAVIFNFTKPIPDFLDKISFGIYSIAHPNDYNSTNGEWLDKKKSNTSGVYEITSWDDEKYILELRKNIFVADRDYRIKKIIFNFSKDENVMNSSDLIIKEKLNPIIDKSLWTYASTTQDNNITYVKVMKWNDELSLFSKKENRQKLRNIFYDSLEESGFKPVTSFFPLSIKGVETFSYKKNEKMDMGGKVFTSQPYFTTASKKQLGDIFFNAFNTFCKKINAKAQINEYPEKEANEAKVFDIQFLGTGIVIDYPKDDVKFMFMSKQGIQLPDEDKSILKKLENDNFNIQEINKIIWDQAIIWPIRHYSMGFWIKNSRNIDVSEMNLTMQPIDFQFLKWKD